MSDALLHRTAADTAVACVRLNVEKPQLGELVGLLDQKN
jgi:hypothetical protein